MMDDPLMGRPPSPEEWYYPELEFESDDPRRRFERTLIDKRDYFESNLSPDTPQFAKESARSQIEVLESMIDRLGRQMEEEDSFVFKSPAELNVALMAANWVYVVIQATQDEDEAADALDNMSELVAVLAEAHWKDDDHVLDHLELLHDAYTNSGADSNGGDSA